jgi:hypothetical protein
MANPSISFRVIPIAVRLDVGYQAVIAWHSVTNLAVFEKTLQPPALDGGDPIMTTTQLNENYESKAPQRLRGHGDGVVVAAYDPHVFSTLEGLINVPDSITWGWPDGSAVAYWSYLRKVEFTAMEKGSQPEMTLTIVVTDWDPINCVTAGPVYLQGTGSCGPYVPPLEYGGA